MKIFVTGGNGFIGSAMVRILAQRGHDLLILCRNPEADNSRTSIPGNARVLSADLSNLAKIKGVLEKFRPDSVAHLAWEGIPDYGLSISEKNLEMGVNLFRMLADMKLRSVLSAGSCWEYKPQQNPLTEDSATNNDSPFPTAKNRLFKEGERIFTKKGIRFYWMRLFFVYGPGQRKSSLIPHVLECADAGEKPIVKNPDAQNDFVYVEDAAECMVDALELEPPHSVYNVGSGMSTSVKDVVDLVQSLSGAKPTITAPASGGPARSNFNRYLADVSQAEKEMGWMIKHSLAEGILRTIEHKENVMGKRAI